MAIEPPEQRAPHHLRRLSAPPVHVEPTTERVSGAHVGVHRAGDARHVWRLRDVVALLPGPDEHVVRQVADDLVRHPLGAREATAQERLGAQALGLLLSGPFKENHI